MLLDLWHTTFMIARPPLFSDVVVRCLNPHKRKKANLGLALGGGYLVRPAIEELIRDWYINPCIRQHVPDVCMFPSRTVVRSAQALKRPDLSRGD